MNRLFKTVSDLLKTDIGTLKPIQVISRFIGLQARKRFSDMPIIFKTCTGTKAFVQKGVDTIGSAGLYYTGILELQEVVCLWHLLRDGDIFFDVGANQGAWGLILAAKGVICHEFEPSSETFRNLNRQIELQDQDVRQRLISHQVAISDGEGIAKFSKGLGQSNHLFGKDIGDEQLINYENIKTSSLDNVSEQFGYPTAIKIDTEGFTNEVLVGADKTLSNPKLRVIAIEAFRFADGLQERHVWVENKLGEYGFLPHAYDPKSRQLRLLLDPLEGRQDTLYLRPSEDDLLKIRESKSLMCLGLVF